MEKKKNNAILFVCSWCYSPKPTWMTLLEEVCFSIEQVFSAEEALKRLRDEEGPNILVILVHSVVSSKGKGLWGWEFVRVLKRSPYRDIPVIAMGISVDHEKIFPVETDFYYSGGNNPNELLGKISRLLPSQP